MWARSLRNVSCAAALILAGMTAAPAVAAPDCKCRYQGTFYELGQCVCMRIGGSARRACCGKVLNNTSWAFGGKTCDLVRGGETPRATPAPWSIAARPAGQTLRRAQDIR